MIWLVLFLSCFTAILPAWEWPVEGRFLSPGRGDSSRVSFEYSSDSRELLILRAPVDGRLLFIGDDDDGITELILSDENEFWIVLIARGLQRSDQFPVWPFRMHAGEVLGTAMGVELRVYDRILQRYVNPRELFPYANDHARETLPPIRLYQYGNLVTREELEPGQFQIGVPLDLVEIARMPRLIRVGHDLVSPQEHRLVFAADLERLIRPDGVLILFEAELVEGVNRYVLEGVRFSGERERQTLRFDVAAREPLAPLDTP